MAFNPPGRGLAAASRASAQQYRANPQANWQAKDTAVTLLLALALQSAMPSVRARPSQEPFTLAASPLTPPPLPAGGLVRPHQPGSSRKSSRPQRGANQLNPVVNVLQYFAEDIKPELLVPPNQGHPVVHACALKFLWAFRYQARAADR